MWASLYFLCSKTAATTERQHQMTSQILGFAYLLNVNEDLRKTLLTPGCHFGRHTPTLTILQSHFTCFHTLSQSLPSFITFFASIIPCLSSSTHFCYASRVVNIYSCIKFGQVQMFSPFCGLALCVFEGIQIYFLVILVTFSLAKGKEMDTEIEEEREMAERK